MLKIDLKSEKTIIIMRYMLSKNFLYGVYIGVILINILFTTALDFCKGYAPNSKSATPKY